MSIELEESSTIRKIRIVQHEEAREVKRSLEYYNLDAIIAVGSAGLIQFAPRSFESGRRKSYFSTLLTAI